MNSTPLQAAIKFLEQQSATLHQSEHNHRENVRLTAKVTELENEIARIKCEQRPIEVNGDTITIAASDMMRILDEIWWLKSSQIDRMYENSLRLQPTVHEYMQTNQPDMFALLQRIENALNN